MIVPLMLFLTSLAGIGAAMLLPGLSDGILIAVPAALASGLLLLRAYRGGAKTTGTVSWPPRNARRFLPQRSPLKHIVVDGSNVMHWNDGTPQIETLREVMRHLKQQGFTPGVVFDANAGHILTGKYQHHRAMANLLDLPEDRVMVVHKGTPADATILAAAKDLNARIVTNDRYRDWADDHPEIATPGHLIRGGYVAGRLQLDLKTAAG